MSRRPETYLTFTAGYDDGARDAAQRIEPKVKSRHPKDDWQRGYRAGYEDAAQLLTLARAPAQ